MVCGIQDFGVLKETSEVFYFHGLELGELGEENSLWV
jgi:hypothetical protein